MTAAQAAELTALAAGIASDQGLPFDAIYALLDRAKDTGPDAMAFSLPPRWLPRWRKFLRTLEPKDTP